MVRWGDQSEMHNLTTYFRSAIYQNFVKIDYSIWPVELLERITASASLPDQLDVGYRVLLDKDQRTAGWKPPSYQAHIPARPTEVGNALAYNYPQQIDDQVSAYLEAIREMPSP